MSPFLLFQTGEAERCRIWKDERRKLFNEYLSLGKSRDNRGLLRFSCD